MTRFPLFRALAAAVCLLAAACFGSSGPTGSTSGVSLDLGDRPTLLVKCVKQDDVVACAHLAKDYQEGRTGEVNEESAKKLYDKACTGGVYAACVSFGVMVEKVDPDRALGLYQRACRGNIEAARADGCHNEGLMYAEGLVDGKGMRDAVPMWKKACEAGSDSGCHNAWVTLAQQPELASSPDETEALRKRACELGSAEACGGG